MSNPALGLHPEAVDMIAEMARWFADNGARIVELKSRIDAMVDQRIAQHPDLANLDDWLDDYYSTPVKGVEW